MIPLHISVEGNWSSSGVYTDSVFKTPMLHARWEDGAKERKMTFSFDVTRDLSLMIKPDLVIWQDISIVPVLGAKVSLCAPGKNGVPAKKSDDDILYSNSAIFLNFFSCFLTKGKKKFIFSYTLFESVIGCNT